MCDSSKCEILRMIRLNTDHSVELTSLNVPRVNGDTVFQEDLYPAIATADPAENAQLWLKEKCSVEPVMVEFLSLKELRESVSNASSRRSSIRNSSYQSKRVRSRAASILSSPQYPGRLSFVGGSPNKRTSGNYAAVSGAEAANASNIVYLDGYASIEKKGWFSNSVS